MRNLRGAIRAFSSRLLDTHRFRGLPVTVHSMRFQGAAPLVSVIMTVHNRERLLREAVESILGQSFGRWELIVIDDGSTDASSDVVISFQDSRIILASLPYRIGLGGVGRLLNIGLELSGCELVAICDSDDVRYRHSLRREVDYLTANPRVGVVATAYEDLMPNGTPIPVPTASNFECAHGIRMKSGSWKNLTEWRNSFATKPPQELTRQILHGTGIYSNCLCHSTIMYRRELLLQHGGYDEDRCYEVDIALYRRLANAGARFVMLPEVLAGWRLHPSRMSVRKWVQAGAVEVIPCRVEQRNPDE